MSRFAAVALQESKTTNVKSLHGTLPYDPVAHRFWRIRHLPASDGIVYELGRLVDGAAGDWQPLGRQPRPIAIGALFIELKGGSSEAQPIAPGTSQFESLRAVIP